MKQRKILSLLTVVCLAVCIGGCASLLTKPAAPTSLPITTGAASNGTPELTAWLQLAQQINAKANPTPTEQPMAVILGAVISISAALTGFFGHRTASTKDGGTA